MKTITTSLPLLLAGLSSLCCSTLFVSCSKKEDPTPEPVSQPVVKRPAPAPVVDANPVNPFRTPEDDLNLPTDAQTAEGADSSIGTGSQPVSSPDNSPSIAITPPTAPKAPATPKKEDQLDPE